MPSWYLFLAFLFILANGFFVAAEFAIIRVRPTQLAEIAAEGSTRARMARRITRRLDSYLSATQLGVTLASLALGWVGEPAFETLIKPQLLKLGITAPGISHSIAATIAFTLITVLHIIIGELGPKYIAMDKRLPTSLAVAHPLRGVYPLMHPAIFILNRLSNYLLSAVGSKPASEGEMAHSHQELRIILA